MTNTLAATDSFALEVISGEILLCFFGVYGWEYCTSLWFEWGIVTKKYPLKWPLIPYFLARYFGLASLITALVFVFPHKEINCQTIRESIVVFGNIGITAASGNLMIRAIIVWDYRRWVIALLTLLFIGQWSLVFAGMRVRAIRWNFLLGACIPVDSRPKPTILVGAFSIYTAGIDLIIAVLTVTGVRKFGRDRFASLLRRQGIEYFGFILIVHTVTITVVFYDPQSIFSFYGVLVAIVFSPIMACRLVRAVFDIPTQSRRGTSRTFSSWDMSRSSRSAPQELGIQLATQIHHQRSEMEDDVDGVQFPIGKDPTNSIGGTIASSV